MAPEIADPEGIVVRKKKARLQSPTQEVPSVVGAEIRPELRDAFASIPSKPQEISEQRRALIHAYLNARTAQRPTRSEGLKSVPKRQTHPASEGSSRTRETSERHDEENTLVMASILSHACNIANRVGQLLHDWAEHLEVIGCSPEDVSNYLRASDQTLASLYLTAAGPGTPSPTTMRGLALRYALDARNPVDGDLWSYRWVKDGDNGRIERRMDILPKWTRVLVVKNPLAIQILDAVFSTQPQITDLMAGIEHELGKVPQQGDALPVPGAPQFHFQISQMNGNRGVKLWIDDREVPLKNMEDAPRVLHYICTHPGEKFKGTFLEKELKVKNISRTIKTIREAMKTTLPEAESWLLTSPIRWADGRAPVERT